MCPVGHIGQLLKKMELCAGGSTEGFILQHVMSDWGVVSFSIMLFLK